MRGLARSVGAIYALAMLAFLLLPFALLVARALERVRAPGATTGATGGSAGDEAGLVQAGLGLLGDGALVAAAGNSILVGVLAAVLATLFAGLLAPGNRLFAPLAGGSVLVAAGLSGLVEGPQSRLILTVLAHALLALPFVLLFWRGRGGREEHRHGAARDLGASELAAFRASRGSRLLHASCTAFLMSFLLSWGEISASRALGGAGATLPAELWRRIGDGGDVSVPAAMSLLGSFVVLLALTLTLTGRPPR